MNVLKRVAFLAIVLAPVVLSVRCLSRSLYAVDTKLRASSGARRATLSLGSLVLNRSSPMP